MVAIQVVQRRHEDLDQRVDRRVGLPDELKGAAR
jgi:hypothetical protein